MAMELKIKRCVSIIYAIMLFGWLLKFFGMATSRTNWQRWHCRSEKIPKANICSAAAFVHGIQNKMLYFLLRSDYYYLFCIVDENGAMEKVSVEHQLDENIHANPECVEEGNMK